MCLGREWKGMAVLVAVAVGGCSSRVLTTRIDDAVLCRDVSAEALGAPIDPGPIFGVRDNRAALWIRLEDVAGPHTVRFRWFDPLERLHWDSGSIVVNEDGAFRPAVAVVGSLPIADAPAAMLPGRWSVRVEWDGDELLTEALEIESR